MSSQLQHNIFMRVLQVHSASGVHGVEASNAFGIYQEKYIAALTAISKMSDETFTKFLLSLLYARQAAMEELEKHLIEEAGHETSLERLDYMQKLIELQGQIALL